MSAEVYRWKLVDDFVKASNLHIRENLIPGTFICMEKSISRWYGGGGYWINEGHPCYIAIYWKPDNGCDIQNLACGESGVMLRLKLVKNIQEEVKAELGWESGNVYELIHGCKVLKELIEPCYHARRVVCADSYFSSVSTAKEIMRLGMRFIGVVKNASKQFTMAFLQALEFEKRGEWKGLRNAKTSM